MTRDDYIEIISNEDIELYEIEQINEKIDRVFTMLGYDNVEIDWRDNRTVWIWAE